MSPVVTVYSRRDCHLCDEALAALDSIDREGLVVEVVDIEGDDALLARYLERIPVIALDGVELYEFRLDVDDLNQRLEAAAGR
ncbi:MAG: glutaredoxin family protein [Solirubrobacteraceae bacterium]|nr:glutaredoxin family protein [Solirubrobacteraceae bacterium]